MKYLGDNLQTAVMVARECTMVQAGEPVIHIKATLTTECLQISYKYIPSPSESIGSTSPLGAHNGNYCFALDAHTFNLLRVHNLTLFEKVIHRAKVYARMATEDKQYLVGSLQRIGYPNHFNCHKITAGFYLIQEFKSNKNHL